MTDLMPRPLPKYVHRETDRHGNVVFYFRKDHHKRIRLPAPTAPKFDAEYLAALGTVASPKKVSGAAGSLGWLIDRYKETSKYAELSYATRRQRDNIFKGVIAKSGHVSFKSVTRAKVIQGAEDRRHTPAQARNFLDAMRGLFRWALKVEHIKVDPTFGVENPNRDDGDGFPPWTDDDVAAFEACWREGTKERVWMHVLLHTGLRRGDAVTAGKQHVKDGLLTLKTEKTGMEVNIPMPEALVHTLKVGPTGDLAYIVGELGRPLTKESFGNLFRAACKKAGVEKSAHGLRKLAATRAAEAGVTVSEMEALFGWEGGTMASRYTKSADRKRLAKQAAEKIRNAALPHPDGKVPHPEKSNDRSNG